MNKRKTLYSMLIFVVAILLVFGSIVLISRVRAQDDLVVDIKSRLEKNNVHVEFVRILSREPYSLQIGLKSESQNDQLLIEDSSQIMLTRQELAALHRLGTSVDEYQIILVNAKGEVLWDHTDFLYEDDLFQFPTENEMASKSNEELGVHASTELGLEDLNGLEVVELNVESKDFAGISGKYLLVRVMGEDLSPANPSIELINGNFGKLLSYYTKEVGPFAMGQLQILNKDGEIAFSRTIDVVNGTEMHGPTESYEELGWLIWKNQSYPIEVGAEQTPSLIPTPKSEAYP